MTSDMAFECLFISKDAGVFKTVGRILRDLSISIRLCLSCSAAFDMLAQGSTDLVVLDWEGQESSELLQRIWQGGKWKTPTVVAIALSDSRVPGAHIILRKPVTTETSEKSFRDAYSRMLLDYRRHARHALMTPVVANFDDGRSMPLTITDIGDGGVGLSGKKLPVIGDVLSFQLPLPGSPREILIQARVLWTREYGRAGCQFVRIPPVDLIFLHDWLKAKSQVKKPRKAE